ncbi:MAG TPA: hypothetical protein VGR95_21450 [Thermoanaerobaculia bacterium]|nr:hypothetical protein [Thermoanaerobaculia bacterium]
MTQLLRDTPREEWLSLADHPEVRNNGALEQLSREIDTALDRHPQDTLPLSLLATNIADSLPEDRYPAVVTAQIRAHAWKDRAQALTFNGKHEEALRAIETAEKILQLFGTVAHDQAIVWLVKAIALQPLGRLDESLMYLRASRKIFDEHGDEKRLVHCAISEGNLLYRQRNADAASDAYAEALTAAEVLRDPSTLATIHNNLACCLLEIGQTTEANIHASSAVAYFNDLGKHVDALRTELAIGRTLAAKGQRTEALLRLRQARKNFADRGLAEESAICGLDIAAELLADHREPEARTIFEEAAAELNATNERVRVALSSLSEHFAAHDATPAAVRHVIDYLDTLKREKDSIFAPVP